MNPELSLPWIELVGRLGDIVNRSVRAPGSGVTVLLYVSAVAWLIFRGRAAAYRARRHRVSWRSSVADGLVRGVGAVALVSITVLLALARAAGRSHYRW